MKGFLVAIIVSFQALALGAEPAITLALSPSEGNPRNSEGDFIRLKDGSIRFIYTRFTGGGSDHDRADLVSRVSRDGGRTWSEEDRPVISGEGGWNVMSVSLLRLDEQRLALFYLRKNSLQDCRPVVRFSDDEGESWSEATGMIPDSDTGYFVLNNDRIVRLASGRLVAPLALHHRPDWEKPDWAGTIGCYFSDDKGRSWRRSRTWQQTFRDDDGKVRIMTQEPGVIELTDGRLMLWARTDAGEQYRCFSTDEGDTWSALKPMGVPSPRSPASIERIPSTGDLLMVWNDHSKVPINERKRRTPLSVAVSRDEGQSWTPSRTLAGDPGGWYCYTALHFEGDEVLLGHCAGDSIVGLLNRTHITRLPISWCYPPKASMDPVSRSTK